MARTIGFEEWKTRTAHQAREKRRPLPSAPKKIGPMSSETSAKDRRNVMVKLAVAKAYTATQLRWFGGGFVDSIYYVPKTAHKLYNGKTMKLPMK